MSENKDKVVTQPFLDNLQRLGMFVTSYVVADEMVHLTFEHLFPAMRFIETNLIHDEDQYFEIYMNTVTFMEFSLPKVKRLFSKLVKDEGLKGFKPEDTEDLVMETTALLNKLSVVVLGYMQYSMEDMGCDCDQSLSSSVAPENKGNLDLMLFLIQQLLPRELGGVNLSFANCSSKLELKISSDE